MSNDEYNTLLTYKINQTKNLFSPTHRIRILSVTKTQMFINRIMSCLPKMPPKATIYAGVNESMTGGTMINTVSNYDMSLGLMNQSCTENFIAQKKKQNL